MNSKNDSAEIEKAIKALKNIYENDVDIILAECSAYNMYEIVRLLETLDPKIYRKNIYTLLKWIKDGNWIWADSIKKLIANFDVKDILPNIEKAVINACIEYDYDWLISLNSLLKMAKIPRSEIKSEFVKKILEIYNDWDDGVIPKEVNVAARNFNL